MKLWRECALGAAFEVPSLGSLPLIGAVLFPFHFNLCRLHVLSYCCRRSFRP